MFRNHIKIAFRGYWQHKVFTLINVIGLSIGISAALVIYLIVHFDFTFDKFHKDGDHIYRVVTNYTSSGIDGYSSAASGALPEAIKSQVTGIEGSAPFFTLYQVDVTIPRTKATPAIFKNQENIIYADEQYFNLFNYTWLAGTPKTALSAINQVVLTSDEAKKYFPSLSYGQIMGRMVIYDTLKTVVTGIVQTPAQNTDLNSKDFISYNNLKVNKHLQHILSEWEVNTMLPSAQLYVKLSKETNVSKVEQQLNGLFKRNTSFEKKLKGNSQEFHLQKLDDVHFDKKYADIYNSRIANKATLYGLLAIATFLLLLGCINFINLTTARGVQRAKEIGIRKTLGSSRKQLIFQFLSETFFITLFAVFISVLLIPAVLKVFADFIPTGVKLDLFHQPDLVLFLILLTFAVSFLAGCYPAFMLSGYKPIAVLKNQVSAISGQNRNTVLRKSLTVTQFIIAQFFIMATVLVSKQIYYVLHKDLGYKKDAIVVINTPFKKRQLSRQFVLLNKLRSIPLIESVSMGNDAPSSDNTNMAKAIYNDGKKEISIDAEQKYGDENYINVYKIKLLAGRNLQQADTSGGLLINETFAKELGFRNPAEAVGRPLNYKGEKTNIVGVVADFYQHSLHSSIKPLTIQIPQGKFLSGTFHVALKPQTANGNDWQKAIMDMAASYKEIYPDDAFDYYFFDESIAQYYINEQHTATLLTWTTSLSILISCMGLLGLAIYTTNQRTKEIGVRKVLGASVTQIVTLLSTEIVWLIILAFVIVSPVAWWAMNKWMQGFADRTPVSWWIFVLSGAGMLLTALITSGFQTVKAAMADPVNSLRSE